MIPLWKTEKNVHMQPDEFIYLTLIFSPIQKKGLSIIGMVGFFYFIFLNLTLALVRVGGGIFFLLDNMYCLVWLIHMLDSIFVLHRRLVHVYILGMFVVCEITFFVSLAYVMPFDDFQVLTICQCQLQEGF